MKYFYCKLTSQRDDTMSNIYINVLIVTPSIRLNCLKIQKEFTSIGRLISIVKSLIIKSDTVYSYFSVSFPKCIYLSDIVR